MITKYGNVGVQDEQREKMLDFDENDNDGKLTKNPLNIIKGRKSKLTISLFISLFLCTKFGQNRLGG